MTASIMRFKNKEGFTVVSLSGGSKNALQLRSDTRRAAKEARLKTYIEMGYALGDETEEEVDIITQMLKEQREV